MSSAALTQDQLLHETLETNRRKNPSRIPRPWILSFVAR
jgi:hypothetical protein